MRITRLLAMLLAAALFASYGAASTIAAPGPVDPEEIAQAERIDEGRPYASPTGEQIVAWKVKLGGDRPLAARTRSGGPFGPTQELSVTINTELPEIVFNQQGKAYAVWPVRTTGAYAEAAIRPPGGPFSSLRSAGSCHSGLSAAVSNRGKLALSCSIYRETVPNEGAGFGVAGEIRAVSLSTFFAPVDDPSLDTAVAWGADGTLAVAVAQEVTATGEEIFVLTRSPSGTNLSVSPVANESDPRWLDFGGLAVFPNGTVALAFASGNATATDSATLHLRPPAGPATNVTLPGTSASELKVDQAGRLHLLVATEGPAASSYLSVTSDAAGLLSPVPIPTPTAEARLTDFLVADDGTEAAVFFDSSTGSVFVAKRPTGAASFEAATQVAGPDARRPNASLTSTGDVLVVWTREAGPNDERAVVGGLDSGARPTLGPVAIPGRVLINTPVHLSAQAADTMGIRAVTWAIDGSVTGNGSEINHTFRAAGLHSVEVTATDRAGNTTSRTAGVEVVAPRIVQRRPAADRRPARMRVRGKKQIKFRALRRRGNRYAVRTNEPVRLLAQLVARPRKADLIRSRTVRRRPAPSKSARTSAAGDLILAERGLNMSRGRRVVRLRPRARLLGRRAKAMRLLVRFTATDRGGNSTVVSRRLIVRR